MASTTAPTTDTTDSSQELEQWHYKIEQYLGKDFETTCQWLQENFSSDEKLKEFVGRLQDAAALAAQLIVSQPVEAQVKKNIEALDRAKQKKLIAEISKRELEEILQKMVRYVNVEAGHLPTEDELYLEQQLSDMLGFEVTFELEENRLNHSIGVMGGQQHLKRHPNDALTDHASFQEAGLAKGRSFFGWFMQEGELTEKAITQEEYYLSVQLFYLPEWHQRCSELKSWYKLRKMLVVNPAERLAIVGVVANAGPSMWVKQQFGGSPEVIRQGKIWSPAAKGRVMLLFIDDPKDEVPLGLIDLDTLKNKIV